MKIFIPFSFPDGFNFDDFTDYRGNVLVEQAKLAVIAYTSWQTHGFMPVLVQGRAPGEFHFTGALAQLHSFYIPEVLDVIFTCLWLAEHSRDGVATFADLDVVNFGCWRIPVEEVLEHGCVSWMDGNHFCGGFFTATAHWLRETIQVLRNYDAQEPPGVMGFDPIITERRPFKRHALASFALLGMNRAIIHFARCGLPRIYDLARWNPSPVTV